MEGAKNEGASGFFKGIGQGLAGLVLKPVNGVIDLATKSTEGIKNTVNLISKDGKIERYR